MNDRSCIFRANSTVQCSAAPEVLGEAIQMVMRAESIAGVEGMENPYERLKDLTRGQRVEAARMQEFVSTLGLSAEAEARLLALTPGSYNGIASKLVDHLKK